MMLPYWKQSGSQERSCVVAGTATDRMRELFTAKSFGLSSLGRSSSQPGGQSQGQQRR